MNDESVKRITDLLQKFAGVTGQAIEKLWPMAVAAYRSESIVCVLAGLFCLFVAFGGFLRLMRGTKDRDRDEPGFIFGTIGCLIALVSGFFLVFCNLQGVFTPEGCLVLKLLTH